MSSSPVSTTRVEAHAAFLYRARTYLAFDRHQRADTMFGQQHHGLDDGVYSRAFLGRHNKRRLPAQLRQGAPDLGLEDYQQGHDQVAEKQAQNPVQGVKLEDLGQADQDHDQQGQSHQHLGPARPAEEKEDVVEADGQKQYLGKLRDPERLQAKQEPHYPTSSVRRV